MSKVRFDPGLNIKQMENETLALVGIAALGAIIFLVLQLLYIYGKVKWVGYKTVRKISWFFVYKPFYVQQLEEFPEFTAIPLLEKLESEEALPAFIKYGFPGFTRWLVYQNTPMRAQVMIMCK